VTVEASLQTRGRSVADARDFALDVAALIGVSAGDHVDLTTATDLVKAGRSDLLVGTYESDWLEVKAAPYRDSPIDEIELAKDVAARANQGGGLLIIGLKTKKDRDGDRIHAVNECLLGDVSSRRYRRVISRRVYPAVKNLAITQVPGTTPGKGVVLIEIPAQDDGDKPFLVHGVILDGRVQGAYFALPVRAGADTEFVDIRVLHGRLRAGTSYLADTHNFDSAATARNAVGDDTAASAMVEQRLADLEDATVPDFLGEVVRAAQQHGIAVERRHDAIVFGSAKGGLVVAASTSSGPLADQAAREQLLEQLSRQGLPVRRTRRGFLVPVASR
jgi:hypothetical protein